MDKKCKTCKTQEITLNTMANYTFEELEQAYGLMDKSNYTPDQQAWFYNLYNRVFKANKQPGCGKCFVNVRKALKERYYAERGFES